MSNATPEDISPPKLFVSYSWSNPTHEQWVLKLAQELAELDIHVIIDKWDLKEGYDAHAFMERMVTDPEIKKVMLVSDEVYAAKADGRAGGVGTETQILTPQLYGKTEQDKFVAVLPEKNAEGKPFLPTYYSSRIYIDLSEPDTYAAEFERLVRWVYDKPVDKRPERGKRPAFLDEDENAISLGTSAQFRRVIDALKNEKGYASAALEEYFDTFTQNLERFRITEFESEYDDAIVASIEAFTSYRNELIQLFNVICQYAPTEENTQKLHDFFEKLIPYLNAPLNRGSYQSWNFDNYRFIAYELYLYAIAIFIRHSRFEMAAAFMTEEYYVGNSHHYGQEQMIGSSAFMHTMDALSRRNNRLQTRWLSPVGALIKDRCTGVGLEFHQLMQADFILYIRYELQDDRFARWWPYTLVYTERFYSSFEIFSRAVSKRYFDRVKVLLGIETPQDLESLINSYKTGDRRVPSSGFSIVGPETLLNHEQLAKRP